MVFWAVQPRSSPTRIGQHFSNFNQYISLISSDNVISQSPISALLAHVCASKVKDFWSLNHFHVNIGWDKPGPAESWCSPLSIPVERTQVAKCFSHRFVRWTVRQIYREPPWGSTEGNTEFPLCWPVKAGAYIQIYIYIKIYMNNQTCITFVHTNNYWHTLIDMI